MCSYLPIGTKVRVIKTDDIDTMYGVSVGDIFEVIEEYTLTPYCKPIQSGCAIKQHALFVGDIEVIEEV